MLPEKMDPARSHGTPSPTIPQEVRQHREGKEDKTACTLSCLLFLPHAPGRQWQGRWVQEGGTGSGAVGLFKGAAHVLHSVLPPDPAPEILVPGDPQVQAELSLSLL